MKIYKLLLSLLIVTFAQDSKLYPQGTADSLIQLSISVNYTAETEIQQGWPLLITAVIMNRQIYQEDAVTVIINDASGFWGNSVKLVVTDEQNNPLSWGFHIVYSPAGSLTLDKETIGELAWWLTPEETNIISTGSYQLSAYIDSSVLVGQFPQQKSIASVPVQVKLLSPYATLSDSEKTVKHLLFADYYLLKSEDSLAMNEINLLLAEQPNNISALNYRGQLSRENGQLVQALEDFRTALQVYFQASPDSPEPPVQLLRDYYDLLAELDAQTTFEVTVAPKTPSHPYFEQGHNEGFEINGVQGGELWLLEDTTYTFHMKNVSVDVPFYFSTNPIGHGEGLYSDGIIGQPASGNGEITFTPSASTPDPLYYQSMNQDYMGWRVHILHKLPVSVESESQSTIPGEYQLSFAYPNPFNSMTNITFSIPVFGIVNLKVYDVLGNEVKTLVNKEMDAGYYSVEFNASELPSGVYFYQLKAGPSSSSGKVFIDTKKMLLLK